MTVYVDPLTELEAELDEALRGMKPKHQKFALALATADTKREAAEQAGYNWIGNGKSAAATRLCKREDIMKASALAIQVDMLKHGFGVVWKRSNLAEMFLAAKAKGQFQSANAIMRTLAQIDGDLNEASVQVNVGTTPEIRDISPQDLEVISKAYQEMRGLNQPETVING